MHACKKMTTNVYTCLLQLCTTYLNVAYAQSLFYVYKLHTVYKIMVQNVSCPKNRPMC